MSLFLIHSVHAASSSGEFILQPSTSKLQSGQKFAVDVLVDSGSTPIKAVEAHILYPDTLIVGGINLFDTAFDIQTENKASNGIVRLARGAVIPVSGIQKIATISFSGIGSPTDLRFSPDSVIIRSSDNKNIYTESQNYYADQSVNTTQNTPPVQVTLTEQNSKKDRGV